MSRSALRRYLINPALKANYPNARTTRSTSTPYASRF